VPAAIIQNTSHADRPRKQRARSLAVSSFPRSINIRLYTFAYFTVTVAVSVPVAPLLSVTVNVAV
jgi:hypothetical protein